METPKIMPVKPCGAINRCMASPASYQSEANRIGIPSAKRTAEYAMRKLEEARAMDIATHEANAAALESNQKIRDIVTAVMKDVGMPESWSEPDARSRARYPKSVRVNAGYIGDLRKHCIVDDGFDRATALYNQIKAKYEEFASQATKEAERAVQERQQEEERRRAQLRDGVERAAIIMRYGLSEESDWNEILEELRKKDQRLDLAVAMEQTRGDWSDGFYRVEAALSRFQIVTTEDKDIANDILSCMDQDDGRVFRDTEWNYSRLFSTAQDQQLSADVRTALAKNETY